jgi:phosphosulfolactate synthase
VNIADLALPERPSQPRTSGLTVLIDNGVPTHYFEDVIASAGQYVDFVKFGWGTALVTGDLDRKIASLRAQGVRFFFGGTLFEKYHSQGKVDAYHALCMAHGCRMVEISDGTVALTPREKAGFIRRFAREFTVLSEVGYKDSEKSQNLHPARWIEFMRADLESGATYVLTEARESGTSGICRPDGTLRYGLIEEILASDLPVESIIFEAPNKSLQTYFIKRLGPNVNLANVSFADPIALETLRLGLRADTLLDVGMRDVVGMERRSSLDA